MSRADRRLQRYIDSLLRDRRPGRGPGRADLPAMRLAAQLRAAHPGAAEPSSEFVDDLARRLRREQEAAATVQPRRRQFLMAGLAAAAAGIGVGFGVERVREALSEGGGGGSNVPTALEPSGTKTWTAVAKLADLSPGKIQRFSANGVEGFVLNVQGSLRALSAACTDQGCILSADPANGQLNCPCHWASFRLDGTPKPGDYANRLTPLPTIHVRASGEDVEVLVPSTA